MKGVAGMRFRRPAAALAAVVMVALSRCAAPPRDSSPGRGKAVGTSTPADVIRLASFNIAEFGEGEHHKTRDLESIASWMIESHIDLLAIQEVGVGREGAKQVEELAAGMTRRAGPGLSFRPYVTEPAGDERCGVIHSSRLHPLGPGRFIEPLAHPYQPSEGGRTFYRVPVEIPFSCRGFDFRIVIVHLHWSDLNQRRREVMGLREFLTHIHGNELDIIILGDFNRYGGARASTARRPFDEFFVPGWQNRYRFPLLEAVTEPDNMTVDQADRDEFSTTIADGRAMYDQFIISRGAFRELGTTSARFNVHAGIIAFDRRLPFSAIEDHNRLKYVISDHRPIWIQFRVDLPDDD